MREGGGEQHGEEEEEGGREMREAPERRGDKKAIVNC